MKLAFLVLFAGLASAIALAAIFSGSVLAPLTSMPVAGATGLAFAYLLVRSEENR